MNKSRYTNILLTCLAKTFVLRDFSTHGERVQEKYFTQTENFFKNVHKTNGLVENQRTKQVIHKQYLCISSKEDGKEMYLQNTLWNDIIEQ